MARKSYVSRIFGSSPIAPMQRHMGKVSECAQQLGGFFEAVFREDWGRAESVQGRISALENEADEIKKDIRLHLPKSIFMPVSRVDLLEMLRIQDLVANKVKDIAGLMLGRRMAFPKEMQKDVLDFVRRSVDATTQAQIAINELDELIETGFR
ncbi:MAG: TIGR00153 family protein, partial [Gammaproteobacteria bacterium]|nr:TIGR00153 family protein [Gammaproteobacteria bacterium]